MLPKRARLLYPVVWLAIVVHLVWAAVLLIPGFNGNNATATHDLVEILGGKTTAAGALAFVALLAASSMVLPRVRGVVHSLMLLPQNLFLGMSAASAVEAMRLSQFSDGVVRDRGFIIADQVPMVLAFVAHTFVIVAVYLISKREQPSVAANPREGPSSA